MSGPRGLRRAGTGRKRGRRRFGAGIAADAASSEDGAATSEAPLTVTGKKTGTTTARSTAERMTRYSAPQPVNRMTSGFANGYGAFALRLIQQTQRTGQNGFVSPASVYLALAITANGAAGNTQEQMLSLLGAKDAAALNKGSRDLQSLLAGGTSWPTASG